MALLTAASLSRADNTPPPLVTTTGNSEVKVVPDLADLRFDIELRNTNLKTALAQEAEKMSQLVAALKAAGIGERDLQTSQVTINPVYQQENGTYAETAKIAFFSVSQTVGCTLRDIQKITAITTRAIDAGAAEIAPSTVFAVAAILEGCTFINGSPQNTLVPGVVALALRHDVQVSKCPILFP
jgi:uncharacterized protein YggE